MTASVLRALPLALSTALLTPMAQAEGLEYGGFIIQDNFLNGDGLLTLELDATLSVGFRSGDFYAGVERTFLYDYNDGNGIDQDVFFDHLDTVYMLGFGPVLVSFGEQESAGNLFPDDYFQFNDTSDRDDQLLRLDYAPGSGPLQHVALSYDANNHSGLESLELGLRLAFGDTIIGFGYEGDSQDYGLIIAQSFGDTVLHGLIHADDDNQHLGLSAFHDFGMIELGAHVELENATGSEPVDVVGVIGYYDTPIGLLNAQLRHDFNARDSIFEASIRIPIGTQSPYTDQRLHTSEHERRFGY